MSRHDIVLLKYKKGYMGNETTMHRLGIPDGTLTVDDQMVEREDFTAEMLPKVLTPLLLQFVSELDVFDTVAVEDYLVEKFQGRMVARSVSPPLSDLQRHRIDLALAQLGNLLTQSEVR